MREAGYTLMELLVVLAIAGFLAAAAQPMFSAARPGLQAKAAARAMAQDFSAARQDAILAGAQTRVVLDPATRSYSIAPGGRSRVLPQGIAFQFRTAHASGDEIDFFPDGSSSGGSVLVQSAGARHRILVHWPSGRISLDE